MARFHFRLGILTTHPIQYQAPWFRALAAHPDVDLTVYFMSDQSLRPAIDPGFGVEVAWDIPLTEGYNCEFLKNVSRRPNVDKFWGADTPEIQDIIRERNFDAFLITGWYLKSYWQAALACFRYGVPLFVRSEANASIPRPLPVRIARRTVLRWLFGRTMAFLTIGKLNADFYRQHGADPARFFASPYCVHNEFFAQGAAEARRHRSTLRERWGLPESSFVFILSGKLTPKKRPMDVLQALAFLKIDAAEMADDWSRVCPWLLIAGDGPLRGECERYIRENDLPVRISGFLNQSMMPAAYAACDCLVMSSDYGETWGLSVNEAMACGLPAIVSDRVGCAPDLVLPGERGFIYPCGDVEALTSAMGTMSRRPHMARQMGKRAFERVSEYSIEALVLGVLKAMNHRNVPASVR